MLNYSLAKPFSSALWCALLLAVLASAPAGPLILARPAPMRLPPTALTSPIPAWWFPMEACKPENGVDWAARQGSNFSTGPTRDFASALLAAPNFWSTCQITFCRSMVAAVGFSDVVVSVKRQLPVPFGFDLSATAGLAFRAVPGRSRGAATNLTYRCRGLTKLQMAGKRMACSP